MTEIATAYISVVPEVNKAIQVAYAETARGGRQLGEALGGGLSAGAGSGLDALKAKVQATAGAVQKATRDMAAAQKAEADATGALRVAAERLNEVRDSGKAKASQLAAAEESLAKAQRNVEAASSKTSAAVNTHQTALTRAKEATDKFNSAQDDTSKKTKTVGANFQKASRDIGDHANQIGGFADKVKGYIGVMAGVAAGAALGGMFKDMVSEARESQKVTAVTASIIKSTGGTAKVTADQIGALANAISNKTGVDDEAIQTSSNLLLTFKNVANQAGAGANIFDRATAAAVDLSKAGFGDMDSAAKMLGKALNDPVKGLTALGRAGVTFSDQQKEQIKQMVKAGDVLGAQKIIMQEVESQVGGVAAASATAGEKAAVTWKNFQEEMGNRLLPVLDKVAGWFSETAVPVITQTANAIGDLINLAVTGEFSGNLAATLGIQEDSNIVDRILRVRNAIAGLFTFITTGDTASLATALGVDVDGGLMRALNGIRETIISLARTIADKLSGAFSWASDNLSTVVAFGVALAAIMTTFAIGTTLMPLWNAGVAIYSSLAAVAAGETTLWATAQNLLNKAFLNNPIGWILVAIIALVAGVIYAWNNFETFRNVVTAVWEGIKTAVAAVIDWFTSTVWPTLQTIWQNIVAGAEWLWSKFQPVWEQITLVVSMFVDLFQNYVWPVIATVIGWIGDRVTWLWENIFQPAFTVISAIVTSFVWTLQNVIWPIFLIVFTLIANTITWLWQNIVAPAFGAIGTIISVWWNVLVMPLLKGLVWFFENVLAPVFGWLWHNVIEPFFAGIGDVFRTGVAVIGAIWNGLKELAKAPIRFIVQTVINEGLIGGINTLAGWLHLEDKIHVNPISLPAGFGRGGWTGPGGTYDPAGVVHADEFVVKKKSRRSIESAVPGFLDALNLYGASALGYAGGGRVRPVPGGFTTYSGHTGVDFPVPMGTSVRAFLDGVVESVKSMATSYGTFVMMNHGGGLQSIYAHLQQATVSPGQTVIAGDQVGLSDSTGNSTGPHLHFELRQDGQWFDPSGMLNGTQAITGGVFQGLKEKVVNFFRDSINTLLDKVPGEGGFFRDLGIGAAKKAIDGIADFFIGKAEATDADKGTFIAGAGASQWASVALQALALAGQPDSLLPLLLHRIEVESGGNPNAINNWDSNAKAGHPSQGLMQTIPSTFQAYAGALAGRGITDPLANIYAAIQYTNDRYRGNFGRAWSGTAGYAEGGLVEPLLLDAGGILPRGVSFVENRTGAPETLMRVDGAGQYQRIHPSDLQALGDILVSGVLTGRATTARTAAMSMRR